MRRHAAARPISLALKNRMNIDVIRVDNIATIGLQGRIDSISAETLKDSLNEVVQSGATRLALDFNDVIYISSAGFRVLLITARGVERAGGRMVLCSLPKEIQRLFDIAAFSTLFSIFATRDEAVSKLR
jgi:anti-anti-sigma factor